MGHEIVVAIFPSRSVLTKALDYIMQSASFPVHRAAIVARAQSGEAIIIGDEISADEGGIAGGTLGAALTLFSLVQLGALALPGVGAVIAFGTGALVGGLVGGATGRFAANLLDSGFNNRQIQHLSQRLQTGHPALVMEFEQDQLDLGRLRKELTAYQAELVERLDDAAGGVATVG